MLRRNERLPDHLQLARTCPQETQPFPQPCTRTRPYNLCFFSHERCRFPRQKIIHDLREPRCASASFVPLPTLNCEHKEGAVRGAMQSCCPVCAMPSVNWGSGRAHCGFGSAAMASRNAARLLLSTTAVPVSPKLGEGGAGAVRQSLNSFTALWCRSSRNFSP
jgi:hypothetical protein